MMMIMIGGESHSITKEINIDGMLSSTGLRRICATASTEEEADWPATC
jgi:hypothetical protein